MILAKPIDIAEALRIYVYDPETGIISWRHGARRGKGKGYLYLKPGTPAGTLHRGYARCRVSGRVVQNHRLAWAMYHGINAPDDLEIDHINGDRADNRIANLRLASRAQNQANAVLRKDSKTNIKGVRREKGRWVARCWVNGQRKYLGLFKTAEEAHQAYMDAATCCRGEFAFNGER